MKFTKHYAIAAALLFGVEVVIATTVHDSFIRPYGGDFLAVIFLYCFVRAFFRISTMPAAIVVLLYSYLLEFLQYLHLVNMLGLAHSRLAAIVLGTSFSWGDIIAYTVGIAVTVYVEEVVAEKIPLKTELQ